MVHGTVTFTRRVLANNGGAYRNPYILRDQTVEAWAGVLDGTGHARRRKSCAWVRHVIAEDMRRRRLRAAVENFRSWMLDICKEHHGQQDIDVKITDDIVYAVCLMIGCWARRPTHWR